MSTPDEVELKALQKKIKELEAQNENLKEKSKSRTLDAFKQEADRLQEKIKALEAENDALQTALSKPVPIPGLEEAQDPSTENVTLCAHATPFPFCPHCANSSFAEGDFPEESDLEQPSDTQVDKRAVPLQQGLRIMGGEFYLRMLNSQILV